MAAVNMAKDMRSLLLVGLLGGLLAECTVVEHTFTIGYFMASPDGNAHNVLGINRQVCVHICKPGEHKPAKQALGAELPAPQLQGRYNATMALYGCCTFCVTPDRCAVPDVSSLT